MQIATYFDLAKMYIGPENVISRAKGEDNPSYGAFIFRTSK